MGRVRAKRAQVGLRAGCLSWRADLPSFHLFLCSLFDLFVECLLLSILFLVLWHCLWSVLVYVFVIARHLWTRVTRFACVGRVLKSLHWPGRRTALFLISNEGSVACKWVPTRVINARVMNMYAGMDFGCAVCLYPCLFCILGVERYRSSARWACTGSEVRSAADYGFSCARRFPWVFLSTWFAASGSASLATFILIYELYYGYALMLLI